MRKHVTYEYFHFLFIVIFLAFAGMCNHARGQAETGIPTEPVNQYLGEGGRSSEYIISRVNAAGFTDVYFIGLEHGLYHIKARHPAGHDVEIQLDPESGALVKDPETGKPRSRTVSRAKTDTLPISLKDLITQIKAAGYVEVYTIETEHGIIEIIARDAQNRVVELWAKPSTGELLRHPETGKLLFERLE